MTDEELNEWSGRLALDILEFVADFYRTAHELPEDRPLDDAHNNHLNLLLQATMSKVVGPVCADLGLRDCVVHLSARLGRPPVGDEAEFTMFEMTERARARLLIFQQVAAQMALAAIRGATVKSPPPAVRPPDGKMH